MKYDMKKSFRRLFCSVLLALMMTSAGGMIAGAQAETLICIVPDGQYVNVRNRASSTAATWGVLHAGDTIDVNPTEIVSGYFKTTYDDRVAYVSVRYFEIPVSEHYIVEANGRVRVRKSPGGEATGFVKPGDQVYVSAWRYAGDGTKWAKCTGGTFISAEYLALAE